jgi:hypothetical protein
MSISDNVDLGRPIYMDLPNFYAITTYKYDVKKNFQNECPNKVCSLPIE